MPPTVPVLPSDTIGLALFIIQEAVKAEPAIAREMRQLLNKDDPTDPEWDALRARVGAKKYSDFVPASRIPRRD